MHAEERPPRAPFTLMMSSNNQWLTSITSAGAAAATSCANSTSTRSPTVAFLIAGSARTFATPLMLASLQHLLVHPLSPIRQPALFLYLKTADSDKDGRAEHAESVSFAARTVGIQPLMNAVTTSWVGRHVVEAVIVNGSAAFSGRGWRPGDPLAFLVRQPEPLQLWRNYTAGQSCKWPFGTLAAKRPSSKRLPSSRPLLNNTGDAPGLRSDDRSQSSSLPSQEAHVGLAARMALGMPPDNNQEQRMLEQHLGDLGLLGAAAPSSAQNASKGVLSRWLPSSGRICTCRTHCRPGVLIHTRHTYSHARCLVEIPSGSHREGT
jgi:hypothetical protein